MEMSESNFSSMVPTSAGEPTYALWADRVLAAILDALIALAACVVMYILLTLVMMVIGGFGAAVSNPRMRNSPAAGAFTALSCGGCLLWLVLPPLSWIVVGIYNKVIRVGKRGASIGQEKLKLKVTTLEGLRVPTSRLVLRLLVQTGFGFIPLLPLLDILWPLWDSHRQTLHDKAVGTYVIKAIV
jgi:uncharacterized RDD family membrane protein YckC